VLFTKSCAFVVFVLCFSLYFDPFLLRISIPVLDYVSHYLYRFLYLFLCFVPLISIELAALTPRMLLGGLVQILFNVQSKVGAQVDLKFGQDH
jgi:hypothetical protein